jgi:hypothetical protein
MICARPNIKEAQKELDKIEALLTPHSEEELFYRKIVTTTMLLCTDKVAQEVSEHPDAYTMMHVALLAACIHPTSFSNALTTVRKTSKILQYTEARALAGAVAMFINKNMMTSYDSRGRM